MKRGGLNPTSLTTARIPLYLTLDSCLGTVRQGPAGRGSPRIAGAVGSWSDAPAQQGYRRDGAAVSPGSSAAARWAGGFGRQYF